MRRKSARNAQKACPEKTADDSETTPKTRRSRRRKRSPSKSSESEDEVLTITKRTPVAETPDTTTKSHPPTDEETCDEPMWKVTSSEDTPRGEIQKLKISLTRPSPDSPEKNKTRRSKSNSQTEDDATSSEDKSSTRRTRSRGSPVRNDGLSSQEGDEAVEEKKGKGKSKGKHKSKIEKSPQLSEPEIQPNNEISENVQVTPQSPSIDKPVDNENDYKVDVDDIQKINESVQRQENINDESVTRNSDNEQDGNKTMAESQDESDDEPLSVIKKSAVNDKENNENEEITEDKEKNESEIITEDKGKNENEDQQDTKPEETNAPETQEEKVQTPDAPEHQEAGLSMKGENDKEQGSPRRDEEQSLDKKDLSSKQAETEEVCETPSKQEIVEAIEDNCIEKVETCENIPEVEMTKVEETEVSEEKEVEEHKLSSEQHEDVSMENVETSQNTSSEKAAEESVGAMDISKDDGGQSVSSMAHEGHHKQERHRSPRRRLQRNKDYPKTDSQEQEDTDKSDHIKPSKIKRTWQSSLNPTSSLLRFDLESVQVVCPAIEFPEEPDLNLEVVKERRRSLTEPSSKKMERKVSIEYKSDTSERPSFEKQISASSTTQDSEDNSNIIAFNRKISIVDDTASKLKPPPSPAKNPVSNILFITNLVRPFTVKQLKELLERTGKVVEEGFWTDRIKSKCYVQYETQEEAEATRNALHGVQWPIGNGKKLIIDYATAEDLENAKNPPAPPPAATPAADPKVSTKENVEPPEIKRTEEKHPKELEKKRTDGPVREWDIGKKDVRRDRSRSRERSRKHRRSPSPSEDFISRKQRKAEDSVPQKLMDDLFLKTKATPSIYWQPLSPEEISMKQQQRLIRMEEHKRRMEENSRMKAREMGRGAFRRRYD